MTLFDLQDGERFKWQGKEYTLIHIRESDSIAVVVEDAVAGEQYFNPYASVTKLGE